MFIAVLLFILLTILVGLLGWIPIHWRWIILLAIFVAFLIVLGKQVTGEKSGKKLVGGRLSGVLIDARNKMSLSRFQIILWTVLALSSFGVIALDRTIPVLQEKVPAIASLVAPAAGAESDTPFDPLNIRFPEELLIAMGISTASLAGASFIKSAKTETQSGKTVKLLSEQISSGEAKRDAQQKIIDDANKVLSDLDAKLSELKAIPETDPRFGPTRLEIDQINKEKIPAEEQKRERAEKIKQAHQKELDELNKTKEGALGDVHTNDSISQADWSDIFRGELVSNYRVVDPAKVQMFFFTILLVFIYGTLVWGLLAAEPDWQLAATVSLPAFSDSLVALLGISHAGYLVVKQASS